VIAAQSDRLADPQPVTKYQEQKGLVAVPEEARPTRPRDEAIELGRRQVLAYAVFLIRAAAG
jgi:hypothetical protein